MSFMNGFLFSTVMSIVTIGLSRISSSGSYIYAALSLLCSCFAALELIFGVAIGG